MAFFDRFRRKTNEPGTDTTVAEGNPAMSEANAAAPEADETTHTSAPAVPLTPSDSAASEPASDPAPARPPMPGESVDVAAVRDAVIAVLKTVYDPEIPVDIYELGLIYEVEVEPTGDVQVVMTLTTPMCPVAETLPPEVEAKVRDVAGVRHVQLELVWEPPWSMDMMSEAARLELNL